MFTISSPSQLSYHSQGSSCSHIPDLDLPKISLVVLVQVDVDWEMGIDVSHLVLEALCDTNDQVVNQCPDSTESGDILAGPVVQFDVDDVLLWVGKVDCQMAEIFCELAYEAC